MEIADFRQKYVARWIFGGTAEQGYVVAPGSGSTITLFDSTLNESQSERKVLAVSIKRVIVSVFASHLSAANGLQVDESYDNGLNWDNLVSYSVLATTDTKAYVSSAAPAVRVRYVNSANVLTAWRGCVIIDEYERATQ